MAPEKSDEKIKKAIHHKKNNYSILKGNTRPLILLNLVIFAGLLCLLTGAVHAFRAGQRISPSTHSLISDKSIDLFTSTYPEIFDFSEIMNEKSFKNWLKEGVIDADGLDETDAQDEEDGRFLEHFYESSVSGRTGSDAIEYVFEDDDNAYSFKKAIKDFRLEGNRHLGIYRLGQCLHVLQDMACPAHTRKDPTGIRNIFDNYCHSRSDVPGIENETLPQTDDVTELFKQLASYSHTRFFSENTSIKSDMCSYTYPAPQNEELFTQDSKTYKHVVKADINGQTYSLGAVSLLRKYASTTSISNPDVPYVLSKEVLGQYYERVVPKAVVYGVAFIRLFFNHAACVLLQVKQTELHSDSLILRWEKNLDTEFMCYEIYRTENNGVSYTFVDQVNDQEVTFYEDSFLKPGTNYKYQIRVRFLTDHVRGNSNFIEVTTPSINDNLNPEILGFNVLDQENIELLFNESVSQNLAENIDCYELKSILGLSRVISASLGTDMRTVKIRTSILVENDNCTLIVRNITDISGNMMTTVSFDFNVLVPLSIASAEALSNTQVKLIFSEPVSTVTAENASNYSVYPELSIYSATLKSPGNRVDLVSDPQQESGKYTVTVRDVVSLDGSQLGSSKEISFTGKGE